MGGGVLKRRICSTSIGNRSNIHKNNNGNKASIRQQLQYAGVHKRSPQLWKLPYTTSKRLHLAHEVSTSAQRRQDRDTEARLLQGPSLDVFGFLHVCGAELQALLVQVLRLNPKSLNPKRLSP